MINIDWRKDYNGEFVCPECGQIGMRLDGRRSDNQKRRFECPKCYRISTTSVKFKLRPDWYKDYRNGEFDCPNPNCHSREIRVSHRIENASGQGKWTFVCQVCGTSSVDAINLTPSNINNLSQESSFIQPIQSFIFERDRWDLRAIIPWDADLEAYNIPSRYTINFDKLHQDWLRNLAKQFIYHECKQETAFSTIQIYLSSLRYFSDYLEANEIPNLRQVNRKAIVDFLFQSRKKQGENTIRQICSCLRSFFELGNFRGWFEVEPDLIRERDFSRRIKGNPDPLSETVLRQIEENLHKLPEPIVRMWLVAFFTAMRLNELALLKKDCLVQDGSHWKIVWWRKKGNNQHEVPISRTIAKVVQEQQDYIEQLWGDSWKYLFCHYHGLKVKKNLSEINIQPIKRVITSAYNPLTVAIRSLIRAENIRDENGNLAQFSFSRLRFTRLTQLFEQGHDLAVVSAWAGHKQLKTTALYYTQISCDLIAQESGHIQEALVNKDGKPLHYESLPKSFWKNPRAHQLELSGDHINTPIYGYCGLSLDQRCDKFRACYSCSCFVAVPEKLPQYVKTRDELRAKETRARANGADVLVEQYQRQADQLDKIIVSLGDAA